MNARLPPEVLSLEDEDSSSEGSLPSEDVLHEVWHSRFGDILIEVRDGCAYVNGRVVEPAEIAQ